MSWEVFPHFQLSRRLSVVMVLFSFEMFDRIYQLIHVGQKFYLLEAFEQHMKILY